MPRTSLTKASCLSHFGRSPIFLPHSSRLLSYKLKLSTPMEAFRMLSIRRRTSSCLHGLQWGRIASETHPVVIVFDPSERVLAQIAPHTFHAIYMIASFFGAAKETSSLCTPPTLILTGILLVIIQPHGEGKLFIDLSNIMGKYDITCVRRNRWRRRRFDGITKERFNYKYWHSYVSYARRRVRRNDAPWCNTDWYTVSTVVFDM